MTKLLNTYKEYIVTVEVIFATLLLALMFVLPNPVDAALITQELEFGMTHPDVSSLQAFLATNNAIYPEGIVSGYFGSLTKAAVSRFQAANGIAVVGRVGPITRATINSQMGGGNTNTGDISAPIMNPETVSTGSNGATISWTTSESAKSRVMYGTSYPFLYATAPSVSTNGYGSTASLSLSGLSSNTDYYYVRESIDNSGNVMWTSVKALRTQ